MGIKDIFNAKPSVTKIEGMVSSWLTQGLKSKHPKRRKSVSDFIKRLLSRDDVGLLIEEMANDPQTPELVGEKQLSLPSPTPNSKDSQSESPEDPPPMGGNPGSAPSGSVGQPLSQLTALIEAMAAMDLLVDKKIQNMQTLANINSAAAEPEPQGILGGMTLDQVLPLIKPLLSPKEVEQSEPLGYENNQVINI